MNCLKFLDIYRIGWWLTDFTKSVIILIECKVPRNVCRFSNNPYASKAVLTIWTRHQQTKADDFRGQDQFGFKTSV